MPDKDLQKRDLPKDDDLTLKEIVHTLQGYYVYLRSKIKYIAVVVLLGALLGAAYAGLKSPEYTASLSYALEEGKSGGGGFASLAGSFGVNVGSVRGNSGAFTGNNLMELYKSRSMVEQTLLAPVVANGQKMSLAEYYIRDKEWREDWKEEPELNKQLKFYPQADRDLFTRSQDSIMGLIYEELTEEHLSVEQKDKEMSIRTIQLTHPNEYFAQQFTLSLTETVTDFYVETKSKRSKENLEILQKQTDSVRNALNKSIKQLAVANDNNFGLNPAYRVETVSSAKEQVDVQANTAILEELVKQTEMAKVSFRKQTPLIQVIDRPILPLEKEETGFLKSVVIGSFIAGFLVVVFFIAYREYKKAME